MNHPYQIHLAQPEWETLIQSLTQIDNNRQSRINAFFNRINQEITISHEENRVVIHSDLLNDAAILAALCNPEDEKKTAGDNSFCYRIVFSSVLDVQQNYQATSKSAEHDGYRELLITTQPITGTYETTQVVNDTLAAA